MEPDKTHFVHPDEIVYTKRGPKSIHSITKADFVVTKNARFVPVAEIFKEDYKGRLYRVNAGSCHGLVHENHKLLVAHVGHSHYVSAKNLTTDMDLISVVPSTEVDDASISSKDMMLLGIILSAGKLITSKEQRARVHVGRMLLSKFVLDQAVANGLNAEVDENSGAVTLDLPIKKELVFDDDNNKILHSPFALLPKDKLYSLINGLSMSNDSDVEGSINLESHKLCDDLRLAFYRCGIAVDAVDSKLIKLSNTIGKWLDDNTFARKIDSIDVVDFDGTLYDLQTVAGEEGDRSYLTTIGINHNGGGKRNGSFAIYLEPWHGDIIDFLELKKPHGEEEKRARDLFYALWIPDLFMKRIEEAILLLEKSKRGIDTEKEASQVLWSLMDPNVSRGLADVWGEEFETLYEKYESEGKFIRQLPVLELWNLILTAQIETGTPYMLYKDSINRKSNQSNLGTIKSSNLCTEIVEFTSPEEVAVCLTGDTEIMTKAGLKRLDQCNNCEIFSTFDDTDKLNRKETFAVGKLIDNGHQEVFEVDIMGNKPIKATKNHKFLVQTGRNYDTKMTRYAWKNVENLQIGDRIVVPDTNPMPGFNDVDIQTTCDADYLTAGWLIGDGWQLPYKNHDAYGVCFGKTETNAKDHVIPILNRWHSNTPVSGLGLDHTVAIYTNAAGTMEWQSSKKEFVRYIQNRFGLMPHRGREKIMPDKLKYDIEPGLQAAILSGYFSADGSVYGNHGKQYVQLSSASLQLLQDTQAMLRSFGINSKIGFHKVESRGSLQGRLLIHKKENLKKFQKHINFMLCREKRDQLESALKTMERKQVQTVREWCPVRSVKSIGIQQVYDLSLDKAHTFLASGMVTHNCNLASVSLPAFVDREDVSYNLDRLHATVKVMTRNLNKVIDVNYYPVPEAETSNMRHRPIGIGIQGLADVFCMLKYPFESQDARKLNRDIAETMYHAALEASCELAAERESEINEYKQLARIEEKSKEIKKQINGILKRTKFSQEELTRPHCQGTYDSYFWNGGCPVSKGILQFDMWGVTPSDRWDWTKLREDIETHGIRNSLLIAPMPTASTSQILGNMESFEPYTSNIYTRRTMAGEFAVVNKHLMRDLIEMGLWNEDMKQQILAREGSIQDIDVIPKQLRAVYKTVWEVSQKTIIDMAADRGAFTCQSQSMNIYCNVPNQRVLTSMHMYGFKRQIKTGCYYLRASQKASTQKFTVDPSYTERKKPDTLEQRVVAQEEVLSCSRDNPNCEMCGS